MYVSIKIIDYVLLYPSWETDRVVLMLLKWILQTQSKIEDLVCVTKLPATFQQAKNVTEAVADYTYFNRYVSGQSALYIHTYVTDKTF